MGTILFFEDDPEFAKKTSLSLSKKIGSSVKVRLAKAILSKSNNYSATFVERLLKDLKNLKTIDLIVADINLYGIEWYPGLSAEVVSEVGKRLFIPVCTYSRKVQDDFERIQESIDTSIKLKNEPERMPEMLDEIMHLYDGFTQTKKLYNRLGRRTKSESLPRTLATILDRPQYVDRFSLYGLGNQGFLRLTSKELKRANLALQAKTVPYLLGNWLLLSVLRFPGILLNEIAAASHLNISENDFRKSEVRNIFKRAVYEGPFSGLGPFWWRYELDEIIDKAKVSSGLELARKRTHKDTKPCKCSVDPKLDAGYQSSRATSAKFPPPCCCSALSPPYSNVIVCIPRGSAAGKITDKSESSFSFSWMN